MSQLHPLFPTFVWETHLGLNKDALVSAIKEFSEENESVDFTNRDGGYQAHGFNYPLLTDAIKNNVPTHSNLEDLGELHLHTWVNINNNGSYNVRHDHTDGIILLSGCYYVSVPENSGNIKFHDPRSEVIHSMADARYYQYDRSVELIPEDDLIYYFPSWLQHEVGSSKSDDERISIAFNLIRKPDVDRYCNVYNYE